MKCCGSANTVYGLGFAGALIYYIQHWEGILGIFKAVIWPGFLVYQALSLLK